MNLFLLSIVILQGLPARGGPDSVLLSRSEYQLALDAYRTRDYRAFLDHARRARQFRAQHGGVNYTLASAFALNGLPDSAIGALNRFATLGYYADVDADSDFISVRDLRGYADARRAIRRNNVPLVRSRVALTVPERDLLTEGIAYDSASRAFFIGSVHLRKIIRITPDGRRSDFMRSQPGLLAPLGMKVDDEHHVLWVAAAGVPQMLGRTDAEIGRSGVYRFDLTTGALTGQFMVVDTAAHAIGDLTIAPNGDVYASDSRAPVLWRVAAGGNSLERFLESPLILSGQGLAITPDGATLYLADYARGILKVDLQSRQVGLLATGADMNALGIDGLYLAGGDLIGVQNGIGPYRVVRLTLDSAADTIARLDVLERSHPSYAEPTLGVVVATRFYYVANSQWEQFAETGITPPSSVLRRPTVLELRL